MYGIEEATLVPVSVCMYSIGNLNGRIIHRCGKRFTASILCVCVRACAGAEQMLHYKRESVFSVVSMMLKLFYTSNSIDVIYQSYGRKSISWLQSRNSYETGERTVYILISSNFDMNIDLMSVFICHHAYYIDATFNIVLHGKLTVFIFCFAFKNFFDEILLLYCSVYCITDSFFFLSLLLTIYLYFSHS